MEHFQHARNSAPPNLTAEDLARFGSFVQDFPNRPDAPTRAEELAVLAVGVLPLPPTFAAALADHDAESFLAWRLIWHWMSQPNQRRIRERRRHARCEFTARVWRGVPLASIVLRPAANGGLVVPVEGDAYGL